MCVPEIDKIGDVGNPLDADELHLLVRGVPINPYASLATEPLSTLVDSQGRGLLLFEVVPRDGHWLAMLVHGDTKELEVFDPYGGKGVDPWYACFQKADAVDGVTPASLDQLGQGSPLVAQAAKAAGLVPTFNSFAYQSVSGSVQTCGRHCIVRMWKGNNRLLLPAYRAYLDSVQLPNETYDTEVTRLTQAV